MTYGSVDEKPPVIESEDFAVPADDDDSRWRQLETHDGNDPQKLITQCEQRLARALERPNPRKLLGAIQGASCTALKSGSGCAKCRICPSGDGWEHIGGYYKALKGKLFVCAEKAPSEERVEEVVTHELVHAYDHCRYSMRVPFVGRQAPYALTCAASACSEVRAYLLASYRGLASQPPPPPPPPASFAGGDGGGYGDGGYMGGGSERVGDGAFADGGGGGGYGGDFGDDGVATGDANFGADAAAGSVEGGGVADGRARLSEYDQSRERIYLAALTSASNYGMCRSEQRDTQGVLDAVFNACMADTAPFGNHAAAGGSPFPPMPPEVEAADKMPAPAVPQPPPLEPAAPQPKASWGQV